MIITNKLFTIRTFPTQYSNFGSRAALKFLHSTSFLLTDTINNSINTTTINQTTQQVTDRINQIKWELYKEDYLNTPSETSNTSEVFPWLIDKEGKFIDLNSEVNLFEAINLVNNFIEKKYNNNDNLSDTKLTELLQPILDKGKVTVFELFNHVSNLYNNKNLKNELLESIKTDQSDNNTISETTSTHITKPLGEFGDMTLNEVIVQMKELKWDLILNSAKLTIHAAPLAMNLVGYGLIMKGYMSTVHNRAFPTNISPKELQALIKIRNRNLGLFSIFGAPLILICLRKTSLGLKDMTSIEINPTENQISSTISQQSSGIFLMISKFIEKIPNWLKWILRIIITSIVLLNLFGFNNSIEFLNNIYYIKLYAYISCSLIIIYHSLNIYLLHKFINNNIKISKVLPDFIINWLNEIKSISSNNDSFQYFKNSSYIQILIYLLIIFLINIIL